MRKLSLLLLPLFFISFQSNAQFKKLIKKAEHKALEKVIGERPSDSGTPQAQPAPEQEPQPVAQKSASGNADNDQPPPVPKPIDFPVTGQMVTASHGIFQWVLDTAKVADAIAGTPQGKYGFELAREKGLKGTNEQIFQQLLDPKNHEIAEEIKDGVQVKFPDKKTPDGYTRKTWDNSGWSGSGIMPANNPDRASNPAWGGISIPSLYFSSWGGDCSVWITDNYIKSAFQDAPDREPSLFSLFGIQGAGIFNLQTNVSYSIGSVLGVKFTQIHKINPKDSNATGYNILHIIGVAKKFWPVPGIKYEPGSAGKFGKYNTVSEKLVIPVRPFTDPSTGKQSNALLMLHDILSSRNDVGQYPATPHYDPSYKIIYQYYFSHDVDPYLPSGILDKLKADGFGENGFCVGVRIEDEKGNSADYRLTRIQPDQNIDKGEFQIPADYPVMTQAELNDAVKKQFSLKNLFKKALKNSESDNSK